MTETGTVNQFQTSNKGYNDANVLDLRLNTEPILQRIETYLSGKIVKVQFNDKTQQYEYLEQQKGQEKANDEGIQQIMNFVTAVFNSQTVQGNFDEDRYDDYIYEFNADLATAMTINAPDWGITDKNINTICDFIMKAVIAFMTRPLYNKERDSYATSLQLQEKQVHTGGGFSLFKK